MTTRSKSRKIFYCALCGHKRGWPVVQTQGYGVWGACQFCNETHTLYSIMYELREVLDHVDHETVV